LLWMFSADDVYAKQSLPILKALGMPVESLEVAEAGKRFPQIDFGGVRSCYLEQEAGYLMARRACQVVCGGFRNEGGAFRQSAVRPGAIRGTLMEKLSLSDGSELIADQYVFACGPWLGKVFPEVIGVKIQPSRQEVYFFGAPAGDAS